MGIFKEKTRLYERAPTKNTGKSLSDTPGVWSSTPRSSHAFGFSTITTGPPGTARRTMRSFCSSSWPLERTSLILFRREYATKLRILLLTLGLTFFSVTASAQIQVVATLPWIGSLAGDIGKDKVRVSTLVKPSQDPHFVEPKPSMILEVRKADLLMTNGLDLEVGYLPVLLESSRNPRIQTGNQGYLDCSQFFSPLDQPVQVDRSMGDVHPLGNPHYHLSPKNMIQVAQGMAERLSSLDPSNSGLYRSNLEELKERFRAKQALWATPPPGRMPASLERLVEMERDTRLDQNDMASIRDMLTSSGYAEEAIQYFLTKPNLGPLRGVSHVTELTGPCGDTMKCFIKVDKGRIADAKYQVLGCPGAVSAAMALVDLVRGKTLSEALEVRDRDVFRRLVQIPDQKQHCIRLAVKTLEKAIKEYEEGHADKAA